MCAAAAAAILPRSYLLTPQHPTPRAGCGSHLTPVVRVQTPVPGERVPIEHQYTPMRLVHRSKDGAVKSTLALSELHRNLELHALTFTQGGASNILLTEVSFDCLITMQDGTEHREYIHFPLKIPGSGSGGQTVFSFDQIKDLYGSKRALYRALHTFYHAGRTHANPRNAKHGHVPDYNPASPKHDQYILHTEQLLVAYLLLPQAAHMIVNRLRATIRGQHPLATRAKVSHAGLHVHSKKRCCGPCEYTFIGLMNTRRAVRQGRQDLGLLHNMQAILRLPHDTLQFTLPVRSPFKLITTVTASSTDAHHRRLPVYTQRTLGPREAPHFDILVKSAHASDHIFQTLLLTPHDPRRLLDVEERNLEGYTVGISGSLATPGSRRTISDARRIRIEEDPALAEAIAILNL